MPSRPKSTKFLQFWLEVEKVLTTSLKILSGMFLEELQTAFAEEWENITGASLTAKVSREVWIELWDKSTIIPNRFISSTTVWKKGENETFWWFSNTTYGVTNTSRKKTYASELGQTIVFRLVSRHIGFGTIGPKNQEGEEDSLAFLLFFVALSFFLESTTSLEMIPTKEYCSYEWG